MKLSQLLARLSLAVAVAGLVAGATSCSSSLKPSWAPPSLHQVRKALDGLPFNAFVETSEELYLLRSPQTVTELGRAQELGVRNDRLDDLSPSYRAETATMAREILARLSAYSREALRVEEQAVYDAEKALWTERVAREETPIAIQALGPGDDSWNARLIRRLSSADGVTLASDLTDQVTCLHQAARQIRWIQRALTEGARHGELPPHDDLVAAVVLLSRLRITETASTSEYLPPTIIAANHPFFGPLRDKTGTLTTVSVEERTTLLRNANRVIANEVIPAYERLAKSVLTILDAPQTP